MTAGIFEEPRRLERADIRSEFNSGATELDQWLREYAWQNQRANNAVTYVTVRDGIVMGYYAIAVAAYAKDRSPEELRGGSPREIPCILLARLAVDQRAAGRGIGASLLRDALLRALATSESVGAKAVLIHCRDEHARSFYEHLAEFLPSPVEPLHLMLPIKTLRSLIE